MESIFSRIVRVAPQIILDEHLTSIAQICLPVGIHIQITGLLLLIRYNRVNILKSVLQSKLP